MKNKYVIQLLYFSRLLLKYIFFNINLLNSIYMYFFFLQLIIIKFINIYFFNKAINNKTDYSLQPLKTKLYLFNYVNLINMKRINTVYKYWLKHKKYNIKRLSVSRKKKFISPSKLMWWSRNILINDRTFIIKILLKKHNLFLTLVSNKGKTLLKQNLGSNGFKKRKKFTGFAIEQTTYNFFVKVKEILEPIGKSFWLGKIYLNIYTKNLFKFWPYRFVKKGIRKSYFRSKEIKINKIKNFIHSSHSKGLRLKKQRRV